MPALDVGVTLPTFSDTEPSRVADIAGSARHVEALGLGSVWMPDLLIGDGTATLESVVALTAAATATERIHVGFSVFVVPLRPVAWAAAQLGTLQHVSGGRVLLGVGTGGFPGTPFWQAAGAPVRGRGRWTDAALEALPRLIAGERVHLEPGAEPVTLSPPAPVPPVLVGGGSEVSLRRAVTHGDGWFPSLLAPRALAEGAVRLGELAGEHGRARPGITVGGHARLIENDAAREAFRRSLIEVHGMTPQDAAAVDISGSPAQVAERLAGYAEAGAERIVLSLDGGRWRQQCELLAEATALLG